MIKRDELFRLRFPWVFSPRKEKDLHEQILKREKNQSKNWYDRNREKAKRDGIPDSASILEFSEETNIPLDRYKQLKEAAKAITKLAPSLNPTVERVTSQLLFVTKNSKRYTYNRINNTHLINVPDLAADFPEKDVGLMVHELMHAVVHEYLDIHKHVLTRTHTELEEKNYMQSILRVVLEAVSLVFEREFLSRETSQRSASAKQQFLVHQKELLAQDHTAYREGMKIALMLKENGWTPNDLPELLDLLQEKFAHLRVGEITGVEVLKVVPFTPEEGSLQKRPQYTPFYEKFLQEIRHLRKKERREIAA